MEKRVSDLQSELTEARRKSHATDLRSRTGEAMQACQIKELKVQGAVNIWYFSALLLTYICHYLHCSHLSLH